jgi:hypothetical protein
MKTANFIEAPFGSHRLNRRVGDKDVSAEQ